MPQLKLNKPEGSERAYTPAYEGTRPVTQRQIDTENAQAAGLVVGGLVVAAAAGILGGILAHTNKKHKKRKKKA